MRGEGCPVVLAQRVVRTILVPGTTDLGFKMKVSREPASHVCPGGVVGG